MCQRYVADIHAGQRDPCTSDKQIASLGEKETQPKGENLIRYRCKVNALDYTLCASERQRERAGRKMAEGIFVVPRPFCGGAIMCMCSLFTKNLNMTLGYKNFCLIAIIQKKMNTFGLPW